jgi:DNA end-binding protein Ku
MPRALWKGAITFGLVHIPVALYPAARENRIDFDWLDKRDMKPVGYKRVNKATGKEVDKDDIVKGIEVEDGRYVVLSDEEIRAARPEKTQTVEILAFVDADRVAPIYFDSPYVLAPSGRGSEKVYLLLREALKASGKVGIAQVVIQTKQHLALLMPDDEALLLNTLRWNEEIRSRDDLGLPGAASGKQAPAERELQMAKQLIDDMSADWDPAQYHDRSREDLMALVHEKMDKGEIRRIEAPAAEGGGAEVIDLAELLRRSLKGGKGAAANDDAAQEAKKPARKATSAAPKPAARPAAGKTAKAAKPKAAAAKHAPARKRA